MLPWASPMGTAWPSSSSSYGQSIRVPVSPKHRTAHLTYSNRVLIGFSDFLPPPGPSFPFSHRGGGSLITTLYPTLCDPTDCSPPGSSVHGILQARILEWVAISSSRDFPNPGIKLPSPALAGGFFTTESSGKPIHTNELDNQQGPTVQHRNST